MPAQSQQQQKLFGLALAFKRGEVPSSEVSDEIKAIADRMSEKEIEDFAATKHKGLPKMKEQLRKIVREIMREQAISELNEGDGLWANIRAKQKRGEKPAHGNSQAHKDAVKAGKKINKESVNELNARLNKKVKSYLDAYLKGEKKNSPEHQHAIMLIMKGALTDANFHSEAKKLDKLFPKAKQSKYVGSKMEDVIEDKGTDIAGWAKWDGHDIIDAFAFYTNMNIGGGFGNKLTALKESIVNEGYGEFIKAKNLTDIVGLSKKKKNAVFYVTDDNNSRIGSFYLKNGKFAKVTSANPNYDFQNSKTKLRDRSDVIYKYKVDESVVNEADNFAGWIAIDHRGKKIEIKKGEAKDLYNAKLLAIKKLKVPKSKVGLLAIKPAVNESVNEAASKEAMGIAALTGTRGSAVEEFINKHELDGGKLFRSIKKANLRGRLNFVSALAGKDGNPNQKLTIKLHKKNESINEGPSTEEKRIAMLAVRKQAKYRNVSLEMAVQDQINALEDLKRDIKKGKIKK